MSRPYTLKKRAEKQAETRKRIVEAAVELHSTIGPSATSLSMIAEKAGVQRHTLYAHFPDERSLFMACSGHVYAQDPMPDAAAWRGTADRAQRLSTGLRAIYDWFERNASMLSNVMRDVEHHPTVQDVQKVRVMPVIKGWQEVLGEGLSAKRRAMLHVALSFYTWRALVPQAGLKQAAAVEAMVRAVITADAD